MPGAQHKPSSFNEYHLRRSGKNGFHVRVGVPLGMAVSSAMRDEPVENSFYVARYIRIGVFVDGNACGGVRHIHVTQAVSYPRFLDRLLDGTRDVDELRRRLVLTRSVFIPGASSRDRNNEMRAGVLDTRVPLDFLERGLTPARCERQEA